MGQVSSSLKSHLRTAQAVLGRRGTAKLTRAAIAGGIGGDSPSSQVVKLLHDTPASLCSPVNFEGDVVWHLLIQQDRLSALRQLLCALEVLAEDTGGISLLVSLNVGVTPGMTPAQAVSVLINLPNHSGETPLHQACLLGRSVMAAMLVQKGADPWKRDKGGGRTPLHYACMRDHAQCVYSILQNVPRSTLEREGGERLVDVCSDGGFSPLHYAVAFNLPKAVRALLAHGANIHLANITPGWFLPGQSPRMSTALHIAAWRGYPEMCKLLLVHQAEHPISSPGGGIRDARLDKDILGRTPQQLAQIRGHSALARLLDPSFDLRVLSPRLDSVPRDSMSLAAIAAEALKVYLTHSIEKATSDLEAAATARASALATKSAHNNTDTSIPSFTSGRMAREVNTSLTSNAQPVTQAGASTSPASARERKLFLTSNAQSVMQLGASPTSPASRIADVYEPPRQLSLSAAHSTGNETLLPPPHQALHPSPQQHYVLAPVAPRTAAARSVTAMQAQALETLEEAQGCEGPGSSSVQLPLQVQQQQPPCTALHVPQQASSTSSGTASPSAAVQHTRISSPGASPFTASAGIAGDGFSKPWEQQNSSTSRSPGGAVLPVHPVPHSPRVQSNAVSTSGANSPAMEAGGSGHGTAGSSHAHDIAALATAPAGAATAASDFSLAESLLSALPGNIPAAADEGDYGTAEGTVDQGNQAVSTADTTVQSNTRCTSRTSPLGSTPSSSRGGSLRNGNLYPDGSAAANPSLHNNHTRHQHPADADVSFRGFSVSHPGVEPPPSVPTSSALQPEMQCSPFSSNNSTSSSQPQHSTPPAIGARPEAPMSDMQHHVSHSSSPAHKHPWFPRPSKTRSTSLRSGPAGSGAGYPSAFACAAGQSSAPNSPVIPVRAGGGVTHAPRRHTAQPQNTSSGAVNYSAQPFGHGTQPQNSSFGGVGYGYGGDTPVFGSLDSEDSGAPSGMAHHPQSSHGGGSGVATPLDGSLRGGSLYASSVVRGQASLSMRAESGADLIREMSRPLPREPSLVGRQQSAASCMSSGSAALDPTRSDHACGVCWDARTQMVAHPCGHGVCRDCALSMVQGLRKRPLVCPFCRAVVKDFGPAPLLVALAGGSGLAGKKGQGQQQVVAQ